MNGHNLIIKNGIVLHPDNLRIEDGNGFEIKVAGFNGCNGEPAQVFVEIDQNGKLRVYVWDGISEDPIASHTIERES